MTQSALASHSFSHPPGPDLSVPSAARMSDHLLDGKDNFACDRLAVTELLRAAPELPALARSGRDFLMRAVAVLAAEHGIDQFLDLGSGIPATPSTHEVAAAYAPGPCRVAYVDNDPVVAVHNRALLAGQPGVRVLQEDLRSPEVVVARLSTEAVDFSRPVAVLFGDVLPYLPEPAQTVRAFRNVMAAGSALVLTHLSRDRADQGMVAAVEKIYERTDSRLSVRTDAQIAELFDGLAHAPEVLDVRADRTVPALTSYAGIGWRVRGGQTRAAAAPAATGQRANASAT